MLKESKWIFRFLVLALMTMLVSFANAGDTYNQEYDKKDGDGFRVYSGTVDMKSDAEGNFYTAPLDIGDYNLSAGGIEAVCSDTTGTEDVNVTVLYSNHKSPATNFNSAGTDSIDNVSTTAKKDSVGRDANFYRARWMIVKFDGQSGNPTGTDVTWAVFLHRKKRR